MVNPAGFKSLESEMRAKSTRKLWQIFKTPIIIKEPEDDKVMSESQLKECLDEKIAAGEILLERRISRKRRVTVGGHLGVIKRTKEEMKKKEEVDAKLHRLGEGKLSSREKQEFLREIVRNPELQRAYNAGKEMHELLTSCFSPVRVSQEEIKRRKGQLFKKLGIPVDEDSFAEKIQRLQKENKELRAKVRKFEEEEQKRKAEEKKRIEEAVNHF